MKLLSMMFRSLVRSKSMRVILVANARAKGAEALPVKFLFSAY
jgi:hypothetical protein